MRTPPTKRCPIFDTSGTHHGGHEQLSCAVLAGCWELGWNSPIKEIDLWEHLVRDFRVDAFCMAPVSGIASPAVQEFCDIQDIIDVYPDLTTVYVDEAGATPLTDFWHPRDALYIFGKASYSPFRSMARPEDLSVRIETPARSGLLWPHQAAAIVLYDRMCKGDAWR